MVSTYAQIIQNVWNGNDQKFEMFKFVPTSTNSVFMKIISIIVFTLTLFSLISCQEKSVNQASEDGANASEVLHSQTILYQSNGKSYQSYAAYTGDSTTIRPVVLIIPEWWGINDYVKSRADQLANLGYFSMVVDFYGDGKVTENPTDAEEWATPFYQNPNLGKAAFQNALAELKKFPQANSDEVAVIGYCFGGAQALNMARQFKELKGAVSFHGNLMTGVKPTNNQVKILVLNGEDDSFVSQEEISSFKSEMDSAKIDYQFINYPGAIHSFTNPHATEVGKKFGMKVAYNKEADEKSWTELQHFLAKIFK